MKIYLIIHQPSQGVRKKRCSENMQQIYKRTPILKSHFGMGVLLQICSIHSQHLFLRNFLRPEIWDLVPNEIKQIQSRVFNWKSRNGFHKTVSAAYVKDTYIKWVLINNRSSCLEVFCRKGILWNFAKFTGKHLCQSLLGLLIEYFYC